MATSFYGPEAKALLDKIAEVGGRRLRYEALTVEAKDELLPLIEAAFRLGVRQIDIAREAKYSRERVRQLVKPTPDPLSKSSVHRSTEQGDF